MCKVRTDTAVRGAPRSLRVDDVAAEVVGIVGAVRSQHRARATSRVDDAATDILHMASVESRVVLRSKAPVLIDINLATVGPSAGWAVSPAAASRVSVGSDMEITREGSLTMPARCRKPTWGGG